MQKDLELIYTDCKKYGFQDKIIKVVMTHNGYSEEKIEKFLKEKKEK